MNRKEFLEAVVAEIENIKLNATKEEKDKLNKESFEHFTVSKCIYGQMTGMCDSARAVELTPKSYERTTYRWTLAESKFSDLEFEHGESFTALEKYLYIISPEERFHIIDYIKGETKTLNIH